MVLPSLFLFSRIVMLNLFQHPTGQVTTMLETMLMRCRNKFGMTPLLLTRNFQFPPSGGVWLPVRNGREGFIQAMKT